MTTKDLVLSFYDGLAKKNDGWQKHLAEDVVFTDAGMNIHEVNKQGFIKSFDNFLRGVETVRVTQLIVENENACAIANYDFVSPRGGKLNQSVAEIWKTADGKLVSLTIYFDLTAFRNFMRG
jgi:ketosteroid isomerase-like protein